MTEQIQGQKPRPRVALLGEFTLDELAGFQELFPTIWHQTDIDSLSRAIDPREIDLIIISDQVETAKNWPWLCHTVSFSYSYRGRLPGLMKDIFVEIGEMATLEEYILSDASLEVARQRKKDLLGVNSIRGWSTLDLQKLHSGVYASHYSTINDGSEVHIEYLLGALILENKTSSVLAVEYISKNIGKGIAWLPNPVFDKVAWTKILARKWSEIDSDSFPGFGDWASTPEWMIREELEIQAQLDQLEQDKQTITDNYDAQISDTQSQLNDQSIIANDRQRRLITAQGDELVEEVIVCLEELGSVEDVDETLEAGKPKREDLRITDPDDSKWEAIGEVRGYRKSAGRTADLTRLSGRFSPLYEREKGRLPDRKYYIVNGETELFPDQRQPPLASAQEDVEEFANQDGAVIWTLDLFKAMKVISNKREEIKASIKQALGRWKWEEE